MEGTVCTLCFALPALAVGIFASFKVIAHLCTYTGEGRTVKANYWGQYRPPSAEVVKLPLLQSLTKGFDECGPHVHF